MKEAIMQDADNLMAYTYKRFPVFLTRGSGCDVWDEDGKCYKDFVAGIAVCNLGHCHPAVIEALCAQAKLLWHTSNLFYTEPQVKLAKWLVENSFADRVFFANSGAEANEAAIKLARRYFKQKGEPERYRIVSMKQSFHGRTMATLSATGQEKIQEGYDPLLDGFDFVPFDDAEAVKNAIGPQTCAVLAEPIQGEGGIRVPAEGYLRTLRDICDEKGVLLIFDEIQTGMGRTGKLFAYRHFDMAPDIMTLAKALGNGLPIGAMLATEKVAAAFQPGSHASTFGGTPLVTAAALRVVEVMAEKKIVEHCAEVGRYFKNRLEELKEKHDQVADVRGLGLHLGMELRFEAGPVVEACMEKGFLINCVQGNVLRFVPPLIVSKGEIDALVDCLDDILKGKGGT